MMQARRSGGAPGGKTRLSLIVRKLPKRSAVLGIAVLLAACGSLPVAEMEKQDTANVSPQKKVVRVATLKPEVSTLGLAAVEPDAPVSPIPKTIKVQEALMAYHGDAKYICSPSGFGQTSSCRLRDG